MTRARNSNAQKSLAETLVITCLRCATSHKGRKRSEASLEKLVKGLYNKVKIKKEGDNY